MCVQKKQTKQNEEGSKYSLLIFFWFIIFLHFYLLLVSVYIQPYNANQIMQILKHFKDGVSSALKNLRKKNGGLDKK